MLKGVGGGGGGGGVCFWGGWGVGGVGWVGEGRVESWPIMAPWKRAS